MKIYRKKAALIWISFAYPALLLATTKEWNASLNGSAWNNSYSWLPLGIPTNQDTIYFGSISTPSRDEFTINVIAPISASRIDFNNQNPNCSYLISGPQTLQMLSPKTCLIYIHQTNAANVDINAHLLLSSNLSISNLSTEKLLLSGLISGKNEGITIQTTSSVEILGDHHNSFSGWLTLDSGNLILNKKDRMNAFGSHLNVLSGSVIFKKNLQTPTHAKIVLEGSKGNALVNLEKTHQMINQLVFQNSYFENSLWIQNPGKLEILGSDSDSISMQGNSKIKGDGNLILKGKNSGISIYGEKAFCEIYTPIDLDHLERNISVIEKTSELTIYAPISKGSILKTGLGSLTLKAQGSLLETIKIQEGEMQLEPQNISYPIENNALLKIDCRQNENLKFPISGNGKIVKVGDGSLNILSQNPFAGTFTVSHGSVSLKTDSLNGPIENFGNLTFDQNFDGSFSHPISGSGVITKLGTGTIKLLGESSFTGFMKIISGNVIGNSQNILGHIDNSATLTIDQDFDDQLKATLEGNGNIVKTGSGNLAFENTNQSFGIVEVEEGSIELLNSEALGNSQLILYPNTELKLFPETAPSNTITFSGENIEITVPEKRATISGDISGTGFTKKGSGALEIDSMGHLNTLHLDFGSLQIGEVLSIDGGLYTSKDTLLTGSGIIEGPVFASGTIEVGTTERNATEIPQEEIIAHFPVSDEGSKMQPSSDVLYLSGDFHAEKVIETLQIHGDLHLNKNASIIIKMDPHQISDLKVDGTLFIEDATLTLIPSEGLYNIEQVYPLVLADHIEGSFKEIHTSYPLLALKLKESSNENLQSLEFSLTPIEFSELFPKGNLHQVASYLDHLKTYGCKNAPSVLQALYNMQDEKSIQNALNSMQNSSFVNLSLSSSYNLLAMQNTIFNRLRLRQESCHTYTYAKETTEESIPVETQDPFEINFELTPDSRNKTTLWVSFLGNINGQASSDLYAGYTATSPGCTLGIDLAKDHNTLGFGSGYIYTNLEQKKHHGSSSSQNFYGFIYDQLSSSLGYISGQLVGGYTIYDTQRPIRFGPKNLLSLTPHANFSGYNASADLKGGFFVPVRNSTFIPFASLDYAFMFQENFQETHAGALNIEGKKHLADLLTSELGFEWSFCQIKDFTKMKGFVHGGLVYEHRFYGKYEQGTFGCGDNFKVQGYYPNRFLGALGFGMSITHKSGTLSIAYQAKANKSFNDQDLTLNFIWEF